MAQGRAGSCFGMEKHRPPWKAELDGALALSEVLEIGLATGMDPKLPLTHALD
jgi:hypothetical protein